jgi:hypothetical protein
MRNQASGPALERRDARFAFNGLVFNLDFQRTRYHPAHVKEGQATFILLVTLGWLINDAGIKNRDAPALRAALAPPPAPPAPAGPSLPARRAGAISSPPALLAAHLRAVAAAPPGRRRVTLYGAARGIARMVAAGAITEQQARDALTAAGLAASQTPRQITAAIDGAFRDEGAAAWPPPPGSPMAPPC